jgi:choloylglycine hydrolase
MRRHRSKLAACTLAAVLSAAPVADTASACTRTLYVGEDGTVITGRNMDWKEDMASNL